MTIIKVWPNYFVKSATKSQIWLAAVLMFYYLAISYTEYPKNWNKVLIEINTQNFLLLRILLEVKVYLIR